MKTKLLFLFLILTTKISFAQLNCYEQDSGLYQYYAKLENISDLNSDFNKTDFMNYVTTYGNLTVENVTTLNTNVISVSKSFPTSQTPFLQNVVSIDSNSDIYSILSNANNSISTIECRNNPSLLNTDNPELKNFKLLITKNPIDETSRIEIDPEIKNFELLLTNSFGQIIYKNQYKNGETISPNILIRENGLYILTIIDLENNQVTTLKIIK